MLLQQTQTTEQMVTNQSTGEVVTIAEKIETKCVRVGVREDKFVKIYYDAFLQATGCLDGSDLAMILIAIGKRMSPLIDNQQQLIILTKIVRENIAHEVGVSDRTVCRAIKKFVDCAILIKTGSPRSAAYFVSPYVMAKGSWNQVQAFRMEYSRKEQQILLGLEQPAGESKQLPEPIPAAEIIDDDNKQTSILEETHPSGA